MVAEPVILGDWGGTRLRLWLRQAGATIAAVEAPGLLVASEAPAQVLQAALDQLGEAARSTPIVLCGMAGARGGLAEAGYVACPGGVGEWVDGAANAAPGGLRVTILPGFSSRADRGRPDVMRGEEAQVFGALERDKADGARPVDIVLPGTHSKWVRVEHGRIARFATCPTGELHARLLGSSMAPAVPETGSPGYAEGFSTGLERSREGSPLMRSLFEARAGQLLDGRTGDWAGGFLSGLLIGSEIAAMSRPSASDTPPLLVGSTGLVSLYQTAFASFGLDCRTADGELCVLGGLEMAHARLG
jgi:2-dehydro-3-deoxygalactonokinase